MQLLIGDRLLVHGDGGEYVCRVLSSRGRDGGAPYLVLRYDTGAEEVLSPEPGAVRILTYAPA